jgi:DNA-binding PadR family transcriptional regulator
VSAVRILVLGVIHGAGQAHGYQVRRELLTWRADAWASVAPGSIYQALRTLSKRGLLEPIGVESGGGGPERTVYRITPDGETEFFHLLRVTLTDPGSGTEALNAAFTFLHLLSRAELPSLLAYRASALQARLVEMEPADGWAPASKPPQIDAVVALYTAQTRAEIEWAQDLADRIRDGAYAFADDPVESTNQA